MYTDMTPNYDLPVFLGTDRPTWQDIGTGNTLIDTALKAHADKIAVAEGVGNSNTSAIDTLRTTVTGINDGLTKAQQDIVTNANDIVANEQNITKLQGDYAGVSGAVGGLETRVTAAEGSLTTLESTVTTNTNNINSMTDTINEIVGDVLTPITISETDSSSIITFDFTTTNTKTYLGGVLNYIVWESSGAVAFPTALGMLPIQSYANKKFPILHYNSSNNIELGALMTVNTTFNGNNMHVSMEFEEKSSSSVSILFNGLVLTK